MTPPTGMRAFTGIGKTGPRIQAFYGALYDQYDMHQLKQEGEAVALAAEANRTLSQARAAVAQVERARPKAGCKRPGRGAMRCLLCGHPRHFFKDCPRRQQGAAAAMFQKGFPKGGFKGKPRGKGKQPLKGKAKPSFPAFFQGLGTYIMEVVPDGEDSFMDNAVADPNNGNGGALQVETALPRARFGPAVRGHLASNGYGFELDVFENSVADPKNEDV